MGGQYGPLSKIPPGPELNLQHSMGFDAVCKETILPLGSGMCTRKTSLTRVFFLPMSVSPFRSSMSAFLSFRIPAQSMLPEGWKPHLEPSASGSRKDHPQKRDRQLSKVTPQPATGKKKKKACNTLISISAKNLHPEKGNTRGGGIPQWKLLLWGDIFHANFLTLKSI